MTGLFRRLFRGAPARADPLVGSWTLVNVEVPHPFRIYVLTLGPDASCSFRAELATNQGDVTVRGSGRWRTGDSALHFTVGDYEGSASVRLGGDELVLDCIPGVKLAAGSPCTFRRVPETAWTAAVPGSRQR